MQSDKTILLGGKQRINFFFFKYMLIDILVGREVDWPRPVFAGQKGEDNSVSSQC